MAAYVESLPLLFFVTLALDEGVARFMGLNATVVSSSVPSAYRILTSTVLPLGVSRAVGSLQFTALSATNSNKIKLVLGIQHRVQVPQLRCLSVVQRLSSNDDRHLAAASHGPNLWRAPLLPSHSNGQRVLLKPLSQPRWHVVATSVYATITRLANRPSLTYAYIPSRESVCGTSRQGTRPRWIPHMQRVTRPEHSRAVRVSS